MANTTVTGKIGDQEVELINAASEATMLKLLEAMNKMAGIQTGSKSNGNGASPGNNNAQAQANASNTASAALTKAGQAVGKFAGAITEVASSVLGFAGQLVGGTLSALVNLTKELFFGGDKLSDFTKHLASLPSILGVLGGAIHTLTAVLDGVFETYKSVREVGGNFGNSMIELVKVAAESGMTLSRFGSLVASNAQTIALLGTSVANGAKRFGELSKGLREGEIGQRLLGMGYTIDDLNNTLLNYTTISARMGRLSVMSNRELTESAGRFALQLDRAAAASGVSRKDLAKTVEELSGDAAILAAAQKLPEAARAQFILDLAQLSKTFPELSTMILSGVKGVYKDLGPLSSQMSEFIAITQKISSGQVRATDVQTELIEAARKARDRILGSMSAGQIEMLSQQDPKFKAAFDAIIKTAAITQKSLDDITAQQAKTDAITKTFGKFADLIERFRANVALTMLSSEAFNKALALLESMFAENADLLQPVLDGVVDGFTSFLQEINEFIVTVGSDGWGTAFKNAFTHLLAAIFLTEDELSQGEDGWMNNQQQMLAVQEKLKGYLIEGFKALGEGMVTGVKELWANPEIKNAVILGIGGLFALFAGSKLLGGLLEGIGNRAGRGSSGAPTPPTAGGGGGALASLGGQLSQAAGWLAKGVAIGASMVAIGYGLSEMAKGMKEFEGLDWEDMGKAGVTLTALTGAMMLLGKVLSGPQIVGFAIGTAAVAALGLALRAFPADVLHELAVIMGTVFEGVGKTIERVFNGIGNIITKITEMRTAVIDATTKQIKELSNIPADNMFAAAKGIQAIKDALDGFSPGFFSGISQGLGSLFAPNRVGPLDKMAELGPKLLIAAEGFTAFKSAMAGFSLANLDISDSQVNNFVKMASKFPDFNNGVAGLGAQASNLNSAAEAFSAFTLASKDFDMNKFTFTREQIATLADGTLKLKALGEQLRSAKDGFQKLDTQGLKNIKDGITALSTEMKALTLFLQGDFAKALDSIRSKDQVGLLTDLGSKLDTLNSSVASLISIEDASKRNLDTIVSKKAGKIN